MKWLCNIRHKWHYYNQTINLKIGHITIPRRQCLRCGIIENQSNSKWFPAVPTKDELRDKKLRDLGL